MREVGELARRAEREASAWPTLAIDTEIRFRSAAERAAFTDELAAAVTALVARYHDAAAPGGRPHRLVVAAHPFPRPRTRGAVMTVDDEPRAIELEVEVPGTPEEVWDGDRHRPRHLRLVHPTEVEEREGGRVPTTWAPARAATATITGLGPAPPLVEEADVGDRGAEPPLLATEWLVEARAGGTCVVRMVTSGFGTGADWDDEIEGFTEAMEVALENLRLYRTHFAGEEGTWLRVYADAGGSWADGLAALTAASGSTAPRPGRGCATAGTGAPALAGSVEHVARGRWQGHVLLRVEEPSPGAGELGAWGRAATATVQLRLYGDAGARRRPRAARWEAWMRARFPGGAGRRARLGCAAPGAASRPASGAEQREHGDRLRRAREGHGVRALVGAQGRVGAEPQQRPAVASSSCCAAECSAVNPPACCASGSAPASSSRRAASASRAARRSAAGARARRSRPARSATRPPRAGRPPRRRRRRSTRSAAP